MTHSDKPREAAPYWSLAGLSEGARLIAPLLPGTCAFAAAMGTIAAQKGLSALEIGAMSFFTYAGASQLLALEVWPQHWSFRRLRAWRW
jgi:predicted branched-subunit amino acid permease